MDDLNKKERLGIFVGCLFLPFLFDAMLQEFGVWDFIKDNLSRKSYEMAGIVVYALPYLASLFLLYRLKYDPLYLFFYVIISAILFIPVNVILLVATCTGSSEPGCNF